MSSEVQAPLDPYKRAPFLEVAASRTVGSLLNDHLEREVRYLKFSKTGILFMPGKMLLNVPMQRSLPILSLFWEKCMR